MLRYSNREEADISSETYRNNNSLRNMYSPNESKVEESDIKFQAEIS